MEKWKNLRELKAISKSYEDPFKILKNFTVNIGQFKIARYSCYATGTIFLVSAFLSVYKCLSSFEGNIFFQYGPFTGVQIFILANYGSLFKIERICNFAKFHEDNSLPLSILGRRDIKLIENFTKRTKILCTMNMSCAFLAVLMVTIPTDYRFEKLYVTFLVDEYFPEISNYFSIIYSLFFWPGVYLVASVSVYYTYQASEFIIQIKILNSFVKDVGLLGLNEQQRFHSVFYQKMVEQQLKIVIMMHQNISRCASIGAKLVYEPTMSIYCTTYILFASIMIDILNNSQSDKAENKFGLLLCLVAGTMFTITYGSYGQLLENESEKTLDLLCRIPWYDMDSHNRKLFHILLMNSVKPMAFTSNIVDLNNSMLLKILKGLYSMFCLVLKVLRNT